MVPTSTRSHVTIKVATSVRDTKLRYLYLYTVSRTPTISANKGTSTQIDTIPPFANAKSVWQKVWQPTTVVDHNISGCHATVNTNLSADLVATLACL